MWNQLKPVHQQVMVITGASSGIGLCTAQLAAKKGAGVFLVARHGPTLQEITTSLQNQGGNVDYWVADVSHPQIANDIATACIARFGRIDTWVNAAAISIYGRLDELSVEDMRHIFEVNFWGYVYCSREAINHLRDGGALINIGSIESEIPFPLNGIYAATKHAVRAFTRVLRMEIEKEKLPISISLIEPGSINTPFFQHAKTITGHESEPVPPVYEPEVVAEAILACTQKKGQDVIVGGAAKRYAIMNALLPQFTEWLMKRKMFKQQQGQALTGPHPGNFHMPGMEEGRVRGRYQGHTRRLSLWTTMSLHPVASLLVATSCVVGGIYLKKILLV